MPPVFSKYIYDDSSRGVRKNTFPAPPVPLQSYEEHNELKKGEFIKLELKTNPGDESSEVISMNAPYFNHGSPKKWIDFIKTFNKIIIGQSLTTGPSKFSMARMLLQGKAERAFERKAHSFVDGDNLHETNENFDSCMQAVTMQVFPEGAYRRQKRYMRRNMRKPRALKIREVANDVAEMSEDFQYFPPEFSKSHP